MKQLFFIVLSLFLFSCVFAVDLESFVQKVKDNQERVAEFKLLQEEAQKLGIKHVYLFGGTATAYARYVKEDIDRLEGANYQEERFDYEYGSIFRSEQDMDIVIDGSAQDAAKLQARMQELAPHFIGEGNSKTVWEVRLLNEKNGDKESLFSFDFQNQHSDSYSTGLVDLMECESFDCIKDVRAFDQEVSPFLKDVFHNEISFYYSPNHFETARYMGGLNPEILSVIRYYTKVVQYDAHRKEVDIIKLQSIIDHFNKSIIDNSKPYVKTWIEKNAKKLMVNALDMEFAQKVITSTKLKQKLIALGDKNIESSTAWYLNKSPLPTKPLGTTGKTAREIFGKEEIIVTHDTKTLAAYESLMKAKPGYVNAWETRVGVPGEYPHGNEEGFYVMEGMVGHRHTGIPVHMKLNPNARYGEDFVVVGSDREIVIKNRAVLTVIYQSLSGLSFREIFDLAFNPQSIFKDNKAMQNRITKMINTKVSNPRYQKQIINEEIKYIKQGKTDKAIAEYILSQPQWEKNSIYEEFVETLIKRGTTDKLITQHALSKPHWANDKGAELLKLLVEEGKADRVIAQHVLSQPHWANHPRGAELLKLLLIQGKADKEIAQHVLSQPHWANHPRGAELLKLLLIQGKADKEIAQYVLNKPHWEKNPIYEEFVEMLIKQGKTNEIIIWNVLSQPHWANDKDAKLLELLITEGNSDETIVHYVLSKPHWEKNPRYKEFVEMLIKQGKTDSIIAWNVLSQPHWANDEGAKLLELLIKQGKADWAIARNVLSKPYWKNDKGAKFLELLIIQGKADSEIAQHVLSQPHWANDKGAEFIELLIKQEKADGYITEYVLSQPHWANHPRGAELLRLLIIQGKADKEIAQHVLSQPHWASAPVIGKLKTEKDIKKYREKLNAIDLCNNAFIKGSK